MGLLPARLLVDLPNWLGDFVHTLPALLRLLERNSGAPLAALAPAPHAPLLRLLGVEAIIRQGHEGWRWGRRHLAGRFDVALTARHSTRAKLLLAGSGACVRLASAGRGARLLGLQPFVVDRNRHQRHDLDRALDQLGAPAVADTPARFPIPDRLRELGRRHVAELAGGGPAVVLFPSSAALAAKRWPMEHFGALGSRLRERGAAPLVAVGPGEGPLGCEVAARAGGQLIPTVWPLDEVLAVLGASAVAVGNDSGLTHLAAVTGAPTVALFGPTDPGRTAPVGGATVLQSPEGGSLADLTPAAVLGVIAGLLAFREEPRIRLRDSAL